MAGMTEAASGHSSVLRQAGQAKRAVWHIGSFVDDCDIFLFRTAGR